MNEKVIFAAVQMVSGITTAENLKQAEVHIQNAKKNGASLVVLPEYFACIPANEKQREQVAEPIRKGVVQAFLSNVARQNQIWIVGGSHPIKSEQSNKYFGTSLVYNDQGQCIAQYDKVHLFDVSVEDSQGQYCESAFTQAGDKTVVFDSPWGKIGIAICYDLRFPEMFVELEKKGASVFVIPAAFTEKTGRAHWDCLLRARAIENQCYVVASAQGGVHENGRETYGHSGIYSPWGDLLAGCDYGEDLIFAEINFKKQEKLRKEFPVLKHRRL